MLYTVASFVELVFVLSLSSSYSDPLSFSFYVSSGVFSALWSLIFSENVFRSASVTVSLSVTTASVSNGGKMTEFIEFKSLSFFYLDISPTAARRRTSVVGRRIFSPSPEKLHSTSIKTMVGALRDPARVKSVTVSPS